MDIDKAEQLMNAISFLINIVLGIWLIGYAFNINFFSVIQESISHPVQFQTIVSEYSWLWRILSLVLFLLIIGDNAYSSYVERKTGEYPGGLYVKLITTAGFLLSAWLYLLLRQPPFLIIAIFSGLSMLASLNDTVEI
jgi:hypothetical protein